MKLDLNKTQFLVAEQGPTRMFRRKSRHMLFQGDRPIRPIEWGEWMELKKDFPKEVKDDGLTVKSVWFLVEITS